MDRIHSGGSALTLPAVSGRSSCILSRELIRNFIKQLAEEGRTGIIYIVCSGSPLTLNIPIGSGELTK